jgi:hypothetical protein
MAGGFKIPFLADVSGFIKGTDNMADKLDEVSDSLTDLGKHRGLDKMEDGLKDAGTAADKMETKVSDAFKHIAQDARSAGKKLGDEVKDGTDKAGEGFSNMKEESASSAKEAAASFGSIEDSAGTLQEILANAFVGFGPAGMAAGLVAAAGIGLAVTAAQEAAETNTAAKQKAVDMVDALAEAGGKIADLDLSEKIKSWGREVLEDNWMTFWADESSTKFQETAKDAKDYGVSARDAIRASTGTAEDSRKFLDRTAQSWQDLSAQIESGTSINDAGALSFDESARAAQKKKDALSDLRGAAEENIKTTENAVEIYGLEQDALYDTTDAATKSKEAARDAAEAKEAAADEEKDLAKYVAGTTENLLANIEATKEQTDARKDSITTDLDYRDGIDTLNAKLAENGATVDINTQAGRDNQRAILDQAAVIQDLAVKSLDAGAKTSDVTAKFNAQKDALINQVAPAFGGSKEAARLYIEQVLKTPPVAKTNVELTGVPKAKTDLDNLATPRTVLLSPQVSETYFQSALKQLSGISIPVTLSPRAGQSLP